MVYMRKNYNSSFDLDRFFKEIKFKKKYIKQLKDKVILLNKLKEKDSKSLNSLLLYGDSEKSVRENFLVTYIVDITFSRTNTFLSVMDSSGNLKYFCSAGSFQFKGKGKKSRSSVLKEMYNVLVLKLTFLKGKPIALHLKNVRFAKFWIVELLKKKFFIKVVRSFNVYPYNGCRKRKMRRKKFKMKKWLSGLRRQTVNLLSFLIAGSNPAFFKKESFFRSITQR